MLLRTNCRTVLFGISQHHAYFSIIAPFPFPSLSLPFPTSLHFTSSVVASAFRHLRSLRRMERDHGWIPPLQEEAENERMHLLIWMKYTQPTIVERGLVILAQTVYLAFYTFLYAFSAQSAHRMVGYLEEEAHIAYTAFLAAVDSGALPNNPAPEIAIKYYNLKPDATIRDVVLHVRADECMHRDFNHMLADKVRNKDVTSPPFFMGVDTVKAVASEASKQ